MGAGASLGWRVAMAVAFGVTAALGVALSQGAPVPASLASDKGTGAAHAVRPARQAPVPHRCAAAGLRVSVGSSDQVSAAIARYTLDFTNTSSEPCTLVGYPRVAAYRGNDALVGPVAEPEDSAAHRVLLAPGRTAHAVLDVALPVAGCRPVRMSGLSVVVPGQAVARYVPRPFRACAARGRYYLRVQAIQPGKGGGARSGTTAAA